MTERIDLDSVEVDVPDDDDEDRSYGDWFWRGESDPADERDPPWSGSPSDPVGSGDGDAIDDRESGDSVEDTSSDKANSGKVPDTVEGDSGHQQPIPKIPRTAKGPVGLPERQGGAGGGGGSLSRESEPKRAEASKPVASSPQTTDHGEPDEMTLALTYEAVNRLADPQFAIADARGWADWFGIVGKVSTPAIRKFQRDTMIELDFFGGSENGPDQRLLEITPESMFYAERMVLVGGENDEWIAETADWEFVPFGEAAEKAGWDIEHEE